MEKSICCDCTDITRLIDECSLHHAANRFHFYLIIDRDFDKREFEISFRPFSEDIRERNSNCGVVLAHYYVEMEGLPFIYFSPSIICQGITRFTLISPCMYQTRLIIQSIDKFLKIYDLGYVNEMSEHPVKINFTDTTCYNIFNCLSGNGCWDDWEARRFT